MSLKIIIILFFILIVIIILVIKFFDFLRINLLKILWILFAGLLLISQFIFSSDWHNNYSLYVKIIIIFSFLVYIIVQILDIIDNIDKNNLKFELNNWKKESSFLLDEHIKKISEKLLFYVDWHNHDSRLSLYKKDKKWFFCITRFSDSEEYKQKSKNLYKYKWIISKCWDKWNRNNKWYFDNESPNPIEDLKLYKSYHKEKYNLWNKDLKDLHMMSRLYFWWRIDDINWTPIWLLLYECTKQDKFSEDELNNIFSNIWDFEHIAKFTLPNLPSPYYEKWNKKL